MSSNISALLRSLAEFCIESHTAGFIAQFQMLGMLIVIACRRSRWKGRRTP